MRREQQIHALNAALSGLLGCVSGATDLHNLIETITRVDEHTFSGDGYRHRPWPLLPLVVCEAISGNYDRAVPAAAMIHLLNAAAELLDDVEDADSPGASPVRQNPAVAVNAATALIILAQQAISLFPSCGVSEHKAIQVTETINSYYTAACLGQHFDLTYSPETAVSEETYLETAYRKSATTIEAACHAGAVLANGNRETVETFRSFGRNIGLSGQIANDIQGIIEGRDILNRSITLPVIFALNHADEGMRKALESVCGKDTGGEIDAGRIKDILFTCGAMQYAVIQMILYRNRASDTVRELGRRGIRTEQLEEFLQ